MIHSDVPGFYGLTDNKTLAVTMFSSFLITIINSILYCLDDDNILYNDYQLYQYEPFIDSVNISFGVIIIFLLLDVFLDSSFWNNIGVRVNFVNESEKPHNNDFIMRKMNSHSSIFQFFVGIYSLYQFNEETRYFYACRLFSYAHIFMGIVSYFWWSSNLNNIHILDNLLMELIINSLSILIWTTIFPLYEIYFVYMGILFFFTHSLIFEKADLLKLSIFYYSSSIISVYYFSSSGDQYYFFIGSLLTLGGLIPKILDRINRFELGTSLFHFTEAFGFLMFYKWIQTLPIN